jgi:glycosyltransferase involved in cell wall biosynthesis
MRILCIGNLFPNPFQPGKGIFNYRQWSELAKSADLRIVSPILWTDEWRGRRQGKRCSYQLAWSDWQGLPVAWCRYWYTPRILRHYYGNFFEASIRKVFHWAVEDFHPDVVVASWVYPDGWAACRLARKHSLPAVLKMHGSDLLLLNEFPGRRRRTIEALRNSDCVLAVSQDLKKRAVELGANPETTYADYEGTDTELFCPGDRGAARRDLGLPADGLRLLFIGNLVEVKGIPHLIEACRILAGEGMNLSADIIGDGPLRAQVQQQIDSSNLSPIVQLRGWRTPRELVNWYRACDLVVLPSYSEGIPNVLMEAAACGRPFVATRVGGVPEIAGFAPSRLVAPGDSTALARAIREELDERAGAPPRPPSAAIPTVRESAARKLHLFSRILATRTASPTGDAPRDGNGSHPPVVPAFAEIQKT